ncbi:rhodanese-like domain-containing protein [soil metagenome]
MEPVRQLSAIMFTDIQGYTALMQADEDRAMYIRRRHREIFNIHTKHCKGNILQYFGDGTLSIFHSALDAVQCGISMQLDYLKEKDIPVRIGIHIGDIIISNEEAIGDSVNITSRIESIAVPGSVLISSKVYDEIKNHKSFNVKSLGRYKFHNVEHRMEIFAVSNKGLVVPSAYQLRGKAVKSFDKIQKVTIFMAIIFLISIFTFFTTRHLSKVNQSNQELSLTDQAPSIAVLPFKNLSTNPENQYFSDGVMEAILDHLIKIEDLRVISSTSVSQYRDTQKTIPEIGKELGVAYVLEGGVQRSGSKVRIHTQLIDTQNDQHVWSETYDRELTDVFAIQSEVAQKIAQVWKLQIDPEVIKRIDKKPTNSTEAYNYYLQARFLIGGTGFIGERGRLAVELLNKAIEIDPDFASAYADLAFIWLSRGAWAGNLTVDEVTTKALPLLYKAIELDKNFADAHLYLAFYKLWFEWDFKGAEKEIKTALKISPSDSRIMASSVDFFLATGHLEEAKEITDKAFSIDPNQGESWTNLGLYQFFIGQQSQAYKTFQTALDHYNYPDIIVNASRIYLYLEKYDEVITLLERFLSDNPDFRVSRALGNLAIAYYKTGNPDLADKLMEELKQKSEIPTGSPAFYMAMVYTSLGNNDLALHWLDKAYINREVEMYWLDVEPPFKPLHKDPRFQELLIKVGHKSNNRSSKYVPNAI